MTLNEKERLILINQYKILAALNKEDENHFNEKISILQSGFEGLYGDLLEELAKDVLTNDETKFALDVLDMYGTGMILSYKKLTNSTLQDSDLYFPGFNSNEEFKYFSFTNFFIKDLDRYNEIAEINENHFRGIGSNIGKYTRMVSRWKEMGKYNLSEENIKELLSIS